MQNYAVTADQHAAMELLHNAIRSLAEEQTRLAKNMKTRSLAGKPPTPEEVRQLNQLTTGVHEASSMLCTILCAIEQGQPVVAMRAKMDAHHAANPS